MSKIIAVIDDPERCGDCPFCHPHFGPGYDCTLADRYEMTMEMLKRPDWCPLEKMPEKKSEWEMDIVEHESMDLGEHIGWNKCIDYILGEEKLEE